MANEAAPDITMSSSSPAAPSNGRMSSPVRPSGQPRRQSTTERFNDILETARVRSTAMGGSMSLSRSPRSPGLLARRVPSSVVLEDQDGLDGPDEMTGIVARQPERNYQSTMTQTSTESRPRLSGSKRSSSQGSMRPQLSRPAHEEEEEHHVRRVSWLETFLKGFQSIELENKGSVARDHLALERTFLAWLRTSLAFASIGIAITQLFRLNTSLTNPDGGPSNQNIQTLRQLGKPLGATFLAVSITILFLGYHRYYESQQWVLKGKFPASRGSIVIVSLIAFAVMVASLVVVIIVQPTETEA